MKTKILRYEELAINAFPAILTELFDGWVLRYSNGYTLRGNCVNPLYRSSYDLDRKVAVCEVKFQKKNLPCVFKLTSSSPTSLDEILEHKGYQIQKTADIMELSLEALEPADIPECTDIPERSEEFAPGDAPEVRIETHATPQWLSQLFSLNGPKDEKIQSILTQMLTHIENPILCASISQNGVIIACGLGVLEEGYLGLFDICVHEEHRNQGFGTQLCNQLLMEGRHNGAHTAYLQVETANTPAKKLYETLGFCQVYTYWYRVK